MLREHLYNLKVRWTGNKGTGTSDYKAYERNHTIQSSGKPELLASSDKAFRGDHSRYNPEELLIAAVSGCHMLWYLHLCADAGIVVLEYEDLADGIMEEFVGGGGHFKVINLNPYITISENSDLQLATDLHQRANEMCFISRSLNFPVMHHPVIIFGG
jgi:organic hydroperoxide reductase OsmC/OhrA